MHSFNKENIVFHFNGGFEGELIIYDKKNDIEIKCKTEDILELVALEYILPRKIEKLEQMDYKNLLEI